MITVEVIPTVDIERTTRKVSTDRDSHHVALVPAKRQPKFEAVPVNLLSRKRRQPRLVPVELKSDAYAVDSVTGTLTEQGRNLNADVINSLQLTVPFGIRHVNAATFKALAGRPGETLLRKIPRGRWVPVSDFEVIDLKDNSIEFKLGKVEIHS